MPTVKKTKELVKEFDHSTYVKFGHHSKIQEETVFFFTATSTVFGKA